MSFLDVAGWSLWRLPRRAQLYVISVVLAAVVAMGVEAWRAPWRIGELAGFGAIGAGATLSVEGFRRVGVLHRGANRPFHNMLSAFYLAAALVLPPVYVMVLVVPVQVMTQWRALRLVPVKRVFNAAMTVLTGLGAASVRDAVGQSGVSQLGRVASVTGGGRGPESVLAAAAVFVVLNKVLLMGLLRCVAPATPWRVQLGDRESWGLAVVDVGAGVVLGLSWMTSPVFFVVALGPVLLLQRSVVYRHLVETAQTDEKTGVATPAHWRAVSARVITRARHAGQSAAVMMVDLDHFKAINDRYGHLAGDEVLLAVADTLRLTVRPGDLVGRFGGEEFTVVLPGAALPAALRAADRIRDRIASLKRVGSDGVPLPPVTASIGVAVFGCHGSDLDELLHAADAALYAAKGAGRDRVSVATDRVVSAYADIDEAAMVDRQTNE